MAVQPSRRPGKSQTRLRPQLGWCTADRSSSVALASDIGWSEQPSKRQFYPKLLTRKKIGKGMKERAPTEEPTQQEGWAKICDLSDHPSQYTRSSNEKQDMLV